MRLCFISTQKNWGGGEVLVASFAEHLAQAGHVVGWIARAGSEVHQSLDLSGARILYTIQHRGQNIRDWCGVRRLLRSWAPDVLIMNDSHAVPLAGSAAWFNNQPKPLRLAFKHTVFPLRSKLKYRMLTDKVVCVSNAARQTLLQGGLPGSAAVVIYGGASMPSLDGSARESVRRELGIDDGQRLVVSIGNLLDCKGHKDLVSAIGLLHQHQHARFVIVGEGQERSRLERQIASHGLNDRIRLIGYRNDVDRILQAADLVVHPSHAEGLSLVLIQAQLLRRPIVATAVGGAAEVLDSGTKECASWIAQPNNPRDLADQISAAFATLASTEMSCELQMRLENAAARAKDLFSAEQNSLKLVELATELLTASGRALPAPSAVG